MVKISVNKHAYKKVIEFLKFYTKFKGLEKLSGICQVNP